MLVSCCGFLWITGDVILDEVDDADSEMEDSEMDEEVPNDAKLTLQYHTGLLPVVLSSITANNDILLL